MSDLPAAAETALLSTTISKIGGPTTTTFTQQMVPTASEYSITATAFPSTTPYSTGEFTYTGDIKGCQVSVSQFVSSKDTTLVSHTYIFRKWETVPHLSVDNRLQSKPRK